MTFDTGRSAGGFRVWRVIGALLFLAVLLTSGQVRHAGAIARSGLVADTHYVSDQFVFELEWNEPWEISPDSVDSSPGEHDAFVVVGPDGYLRSLLLFTSDLEAVLNATIDIRDDQYDNLDVLKWDEGETAIGLPYLAATLGYEYTSNGEPVRLVEYVEVSLAYTIDLDHASLLLSLTAPAETLTDAYDDAQDSFLLNQGMLGPLFSGRPAGGRVTPHGDDASSHRPNRGGASDAEAEYLATLSGEIDALTESVDRFYTLLNDPNLGDDATIRELSDILNSWIDAYDYAQSLTPPRGYEEVHAAYIAFTGYLAGAATALLGQDLTTAVAMLEQAQQQGYVLTDLLADAGASDLLDRKSG